MPLGEWIKKQCESSVWATLSLAMLQSSKTTNGTAKKELFKVKVKVKVKCMCTWRYRYPASIRLRMLH